MMPTKRADELMTIKTIYGPISLPKWLVLMTLFNGAMSPGLGAMHRENKKMDEELARELLGTATYFDYLGGRVLKVEMGFKTLATTLYNRDNGKNRAEDLLYNVWKVGTRAEKLKNRKV
jgi:hypothetical protein